MLINKVNKQQEELKYRYEFKYEIDIHQMIILKHRENTENI